MIKNMFSIKEKICLLILIFFQMTFLIISWYQSKWKVYSFFNKETGINEAHREIISNIDFVTMMIFLILFSIGLAIILKTVDIITMPIVTPISILITVGLILQRYCSRNVKSDMFYIFLGVGVMTLGILGTKFFCIEEHVFFPKSIKRLVRILSVILFGWTVVAKVHDLLFKESWVINGSTAFVLGNSRFHFMPVELLKLLLIMYVGFNYKRIYSSDDIWKKEFLHGMFVPVIISVLLSNDLGNLLIIFAIVFLAKLIRTNRTKLFSPIVLLKGIFLFIIAYKIMMFLFNIAYRIMMFLYIFFNKSGHVAKRFSDWRRILIDPMANDNHRRALLSILKNGIWGNNLNERFYVITNSAANTDYCICLIFALFGIGLVVVVLICYLMLMRCGISLNQAGNNQKLYVLSNGMIAILLLQTIVHIGGNLDVIPFTGVTLPFISHGGTSMICNFLCIGIAIGGQATDNVLKWSIIRNIVNIIKMKN